MNYILKEGVYMGERPIQSFLPRTFKLIPSYPPIEIHYKRRRNRVTTDLRIRSQWEDSSNAPSYEVCISVIGEGNLKRSLHHLTRKIPDLILEDSTETLIFVGDSVLIHARSRD